MPQLDLTTFISLYFIVLFLFWLQFTVSYIAVSYSFQYLFSAYYFSFSVVTSTLLKLKAVVGAKAKTVATGVEKKSNIFAKELSSFYKK